MTKDDTMDYNNNNNNLYNSLQVVQDWQHLLILLTVIRPFVFGFETADKLLGIVVTGAVNIKVDTAHRLCFCLDLVHSVIYAIHTDRHHVSYTIDLTYWKLRT